MATPSPSSVNFGTQTSKPEYYDIMVMGKTGQGKSMLGNKLLLAPDQNLQLTPEERCLFRTQFDVESPREKPWTGFRTAQSVPMDDRKRSVTIKCELVANEFTKMRVLDTPGLSPPSEEANSVTAYEDNRKVCFQIAKQLHPNKNLIPVKCKRVVYFFPYRGVPEKNDANLQEELKAMYDFFGTAIFKHMVIIATQEERCQSIPFGDNECDQVQEIFIEAISIVTSGDITDSPPVIYIGYNDNCRAVRRKVQYANVFAEDDYSYFEPTYKANKCLYCNLDIHCSESAQVDVQTPIAVSNGSEYKKYKKSRCHPYFVPKYSKVAKIAGTIGHTLTLGIPHILNRGFLNGKTLWPSMFNSEKMCPFCQGSPGSEGCSPVGNTVRVQGEDKEIDHYTHFNS